MPNSLCTNTSPKHGDYSLLWVKMKIIHYHGQVTSNLMQQAVKNKNPLHIQPLLIPFHSISLFHMAKIIFNLPETNKDALFANLVLKRPNVPIKVGDFFPKCLM